MAIPVVASCLQSSSPIRHQGWTRARAQMGGCQTTLYKYMITQYMLLSLKLPRSGNMKYTVRQGASQISAIKHMQTLLTMAKPIRENHLTTALATSAQAPADKRAHRRVC